MEGEWMAARRWLCAGVRPEEKTNRGEGRRDEDLAVVGDGSNSGAASAELHNLLFLIIKRNHTWVFQKWNKF